MNRYFTLLLILALIILMALIMQAVAGAIGDCLPLDCCNQGDCVPALPGELTYDPNTDTWTDHVTGTTLPASAKKTNGLRYVREKDCLPTTYVCRSKYKTITYCILKATKF